MDPNSPTANKLNPGVRRSNINKAKDKANDWKANNREAKYRKQNPNIRFRL